MGLSVFSLGPTSAQPRAISPCLSHRTPSQALPQLCPAWPASPGSPPWADVLPSLGHPHPQGGCPAPWLGWWDGTHLPGPSLPVLGSPCSPWPLTRWATVPWHLHLLSQPCIRESEKMQLMLLPWEKNTFSSLSPTRSPTAVVSCERLDLNLI